MVNFSHGCSCEIITLRGTTSRLELRCHWAETGGGHNNRNERNMKITALRTKLDQLTAELEAAKNPTVTTVSDDDVSVS